LAVDKTPRAGGGRVRTGGATTPARARPVTMRDIARATNLSQSTVSRVLNGTQTVVPITQATRERVLATARDLGYRPNPFARGLRGASTMLLGVIVREITDPFFAGAIEAVTTAATQRGYNVVLGHAHARAEEAITLYGVLEARHCDAILLLGDMRDQPRLLKDLRGEHVPVVALWQGAQTRDVPCVAVDNDTGIRAVLDHLTGLGHRRIAFVGGRRGLGDIKEREGAFEQYFADAGEPLRDGYVERGVNEPTIAVPALARLLALPEPPTAVVAATDVIAIGLLHAAHLHGLRVPDQLSITGFDDIPMAAFTVPALTTLRMPVSEIVDQALRLALDEMEASAEEPIPVLAPTLVVRSSTGPPRAG
jgi:DNA-binding LacI/PurR family transcriptional regulator